MTSSHRRWSLSRSRGSKPIANCEKAVGTSSTSATLPADQAHRRGGRPGSAPPFCQRSEGTEMESEGGQATGTKDKDYNIIWFTEQCLSNALRLETYVQDAERDGDSELADFFRRAQAESRKGGEQGKALLKSRCGARAAALPAPRPGASATCPRSGLSPTGRWPGPGGGRGPGGRAAARRSCC